MLQTDWIKADHALIRPLIQDGAAAYAKENGITPRTPDAEPQTN
ncbi:hypothetical protein [Aureimonas altamirensis]|nr:hypothetical protein [Aureimonas altamirensis]